MSSHLLRGGAFLTLFRQEADKQQSRQSPTESEAEEELRKFFHLADARKGMQTLMPGGFIDNVWHKMLLKPTRYSIFCQQAVGRLVRHLPIQGEGELAWVKDYEVMFHHPLPSIWFTDASGMLNEVAYDDYVETDIVKMSWDCGPAMDD